MDDLNKRYEDEKIKFFAWLDEQDLKEITVFWTKPIVTVEDEEL